MTAIDPEQCGELYSKLASNGFRGPDKRHRIHHKCCMAIIFSSATTSRIYLQILCAYTTSTGEMFYLSMDCDFKFAAISMFFIPRAT
jgi:hypothetical protein